MQALYLSAPQEFQSRVPAKVECWEVSFPDCCVVLLEDF